MSKAIAIFLVIFFCRDVSCAEICEEIIAPMCRGLIPYNMTKMPNMFGHTTQAQAYRRMERYWSGMDLPCSNNFRLTICGVFFPQCESGDGYVTTKLPCREGCLYAKRECRKSFKQLNMKWPSKVLKCKKLSRKKSKNCVKPYPKVKTPPVPQYLYCEPNQIEMCNGFNIGKGSLPNFFQQGKPNEVATEMENYRLLLRSNCSPNLRFFICGVYKPFCPSNNRPIVLPCRELCQEVKQSCESIYRKLYNGMRWPSKFQCHRYPLSNSTMMPCKMSDVITDDDEEPFIPTRN
ncbi:frizzled-10-like [Ylistrum balloti]|uniref:frizzled-10-like n=1 Tax=Ylistrum balloti TaxID=509963 RepID=UPI002905B7DA|nr:frizzled-10-like [Ylistrum balloti]